MTDVQPETPSLREIITDALSYWEPRRLLYNAVLVVIVVGHFCAALPASRASITVNGVLFLFLLAVLANLCYCAAYLPDVFAQLSGFHAAWCRWRGGVLLLGIVFAGTLTHFFALELFADPSTGGFL